MLLIEVAAAKMTKADMRKRIDYLTNKKSKIPPGNITHKRQVEKELAVLHRLFFSKYSPVKIMSGGLPS
jgi:hypothetical protein